MRSSQPCRRWTAASWSKGCSGRVLDHRSHRGAERRPDRRSRPQPILAVRGHHRLSSSRDTRIKSRWTAARVWSPALRKIPSQGQRGRRRSPGAHPLPLEAEREEIPPRGQLSPGRPAGIDPPPTGEPSVRFPAPPHVIHFAPASARLHERLELTSKQPESCPLPEPLASTEPTPCAASSAVRRDSTAPRPPAATSAPPRRPASMGSTTRSARRSPTRDARQGPGRPRRTGWSWRRSNRRPTVLDDSYGQPIRGGKAAASGSRVVPGSAGPAPKKAAARSGVKGRPPQRVGQRAVRGVEVAWTRRQVPTRLLDLVQREPQTEGNDFAYLRRR